MDGFLELTLLALVQGLTEFLPISSSGHLVLTRGAMDTLGDGAGGASLVVEVALHVGTLLAVVAVYRRELLGLLSDLLAGRPREPLLLALGTLPVAIVGFALGGAVEAAFTSTRAAGLGLLATSVVLGAGEWARRRRGEVALPEDAHRLTMHVVLLVGLAQAVAILPGVSRSGSTIAAGLLLGLPPRRAARLSFLLSVPAIAGAAVLKLPAAWGDDVGPGGAVLLWATLFAGLVGWVALRALLAFLDRGAFAWFAGYCLLVGSGVLLLA